MIGEILNLFFPPRCPACGELRVGAASFCAGCASTLTEVGPQHCARCAQPEVNGLCVHCQQNLPAFERAWAPFLHGGALAQAIHRFKYEDRPHLAVPLVKVLFPLAQDDLRWCEALAPIALHDRRLRQRGYDQALLLARELAAMAGRPMEARAVRRVRNTPPQVGLDRAQRVQNVEGAFEADPKLIKGKRILLVDDVLTTGATADAAAQALLRADVQAVRVLALARAS